MSQEIATLFLCRDKKYAIIFQDHYEDGGQIMAVSYNRLWKLLVDKKMSKAELRKAANIAPNTMTKLRRVEEVSMNVMSRICGVLNANSSSNPRLCKNI